MAPAYLLLSAWAFAQSPAQTPPSPVEQRTPWRLAEALGLPEWLTLTLKQRTRFESVSDDIRVSQPGSNELWSLRTLLAAEARKGNWRFGAEMQDSRVYGDRPDRFLNTGLVNAVELLQAYVGVSLSDALAEGDTLDFQLGRQTMDLGSRRLVARNRFRNTINAFTGLDASWRGSDGSTLRAFYVLPVLRLPRDQSSLHDNEIEADEELDHTHFIGLHGSTPILEGAATAEAYALHLNENDERFVGTRDRRIWTLGARVNRRPAASEFHYEWESAYQFGQSRALTSDIDVKDLDHDAQFHHLTLGYRFPGKYKVDLEALFDYASGDKDPNDGKNNRFDTLFGARRFEYGPTGIFGAFARSNIISPGLRLKMRPSKRSQLMIAHRLHYLASSKDFWTTSGLVDPTGASGNFLGQLIEARLRYDVVPKNLGLEMGVAQLFAGSFIEDAPNNNGQGDSTYGYIATTLSF